MMLRLLLLMLAILIVHVLVRDALRQRRRRLVTRTGHVETVRCVHCGVHLPADQASRHTSGCQDLPTGSTDDDR